MPTGLPSSASTTTRSAAGRRDHDPHTRPRRDLRRRELARHAAAPARGAGAAGDALERGVDFDDLLDQRRVFVLLRVRGEEPGGVGEHHQRVRMEQVGDERGEEVVVAVADLVVGDRVVLVHDRQHAEVEQALQRLARVEVLTAVHEVVRREQHLAADDVVRGEDRVQPLDEAGLADRGERLQRADVGRAAS